MKHYNKLISWVSVLSISVGVATALQGQDTDEDVVELSPFEVTSEGSIGYNATETLAGTRLRTDLRDVANAVSVINQEFLQDTGSQSQEDLLVYTTNTEVGGIQGNFANTGDGNEIDDNSQRTSPQSNTRIRGLAEADNTRNFFLTDTPWDSYIVDRVDIQRGANSVLFGVGSPAGIINTDLIDPLFTDANTVDLQFGSYGSYRGSFDINKEVIEDQLAIRVAGLYEDTQYRQSPAYEEDQRIYGAIKWNPDFLQTDSISTSFNFNYENGLIRANRPRVLPPIDRITPWFHIGRPTYDASILNEGDYDTWVGLGQPAGFGVTSGNGYFSNGNFNPNWHPQISDRGADWFDGPIAVFTNPGDVTQSFLTLGQTVDLTDPPEGAPGVPFAPWGGIAPTDQYANKVLQYARASGDAKLAAQFEGSAIGAYKRSVLNNPGVFDFYNKLLDGPNKYENEDFENYNFSAAQTYFDNRVGLEFVYDNQSYERENSDYFSSGGYHIAIDIMENFADGTPNPNVGRPLVGSRGGTSQYEERERETMRVTAFAELDFSDFLDEDTLLDKILGRHVFTGVYSDSDYNRNTLGWERRAADDTYGPGVGSAVIQANRQVATANYLGGYVGNADPNNLNLSRLNAKRTVTSGYMSVYDWTVVHPDADASNPDKYVGWNGYETGIWDAGAGDIDNLYTAGAARKQLTTLESQVLVWQGFLLNDNIVPMFSWRKDKQSFYGSGTPTIANYGSQIFEDPEWYVPGGPDDVGANRRFNSEEKETTSWGIVVHTPEFINEMLPFGLSISGFYNESENFQPQAGRVDPFGSPISSPTGETKDYGFVVGTQDNRFVLKFNWYETSVSDASLGGALGGDYLLGMGEGWAYMFATRAKKAYDDNAGFADFGVDHTIIDGVDTRPDMFLPYQPRAGQSIDDAEAEFLSAVNSFLANPPPAALQDAWGYNVNEWEQNPGDWLNITYLDGMSVTGDTYSEGLEIEFTAQITPNWNLTLNASESKATRLNIAQPIADWVEERYEFYQTSAGDVRFWGGWVNDGETLRGKFTREFYGNYQLQRLLEGANVPELRNWRFNLITNYSFDNGPLNGLNIGGAYRWQDKVVIGYPVINSADPLDASTLPSYDINNPYYGPTESNIDLWIGYSRALTQHVDWRIQLNVRNLFSDDKLIPITSQPDGTPAAYRIPDETTWFITNTFSF